jgi:hypothetical protein
VQNLQHLNKKGRLDLQEVSLCKNCPERLGEMLAYRNRLLRKKISSARCAHFALIGRRNGQSLDHQQYLPSVI